MEQESWPRAGAVPRNEAHGHGAPRGEQRREPYDTAYAALDLGTNNCRLLIARPTEGGFRIVNSFSRIIRLGEGIAQTGRISEAGHRPRAVGACASAATRSSPSAPARTRLIATEACRAATEPGRISRAGRPRTRHSPRGDRPRDRSDAGGHRLPAAARPAGERRDPVRYRRRLVGTGAAGRAIRRGRRLRRKSPAGCRCRSASSRWPSAAAACMSRRESYAAMIDEVAGDAGAVRAGSTAATSTACICSAPPAR